MHKTIMRLCAGLFLACAALIACDAPQVIKTTIGQNTAPSQASWRSEVDNTARRFLNQIQAQSIAENREFCGYFVLSGGQVNATSPSRGGPASCEYASVPPNVLASYHTHAAYVFGYDNEVPSVQDVEHAMSANISDYVSTPGGRLWRVDAQTGTATQLCGLGCLTADVGNVIKPNDIIQQAYTLEQLRARQN